MRGCAVNFRFESHLAHSEAGARAGLGITLISFNRIIQTDFKEGERETKFNYLRSASIPEATALLAEHGKKAKVIAGGTDLLVGMKNKQKRPEYLIDILGIPGLDSVEYDKTKGLSIGALTSIRSLETSHLVRQLYPIVSQAAGLLGSVSIRNMATVGGNLCNASPSAEMAPALITLGAKARIAGAEGERTVPLEDFFVSPGVTVLADRELLTGVSLPPPAPNSNSVYCKYAIRKEAEVAIVGVAVSLTLTQPGNVCKDIRIALGAVAPTPIRAKGAEAVLRDKQISEALIEESSLRAMEEARPITDVRASADYRREMVRVFTRRAMEQTFARWKGGKPQWNK
jgi:aerobic carbon-monoxide dehydrogenase medium subunit